jgi:uncharacterized membrane protein YoaK (UPF0700 family)
MTSNQAEELATYILLGMTAVTGLVDAASFLALGRIFTANMTGNVVFLAFATARVPGLSITLSSAASVRALREHVVADDGPEFARRALDGWAYRSNVKMNEEVQAHD